MGMSIPTEYGGAEMDAVSYALALMEIARADASTAVILSVNGLVGVCVAQWGSAAQKAKYFPRLCTAKGLGAFAVTEPQAGSDVQGIHMRAERSGDQYILNGEKVWISNASRAGTFVVIAATGEGRRSKAFSAFLIDAGTKGLVIGRSEPKMGQRASHACNVTFNNCRVAADQMLGPEGAGVKVALSALDSGRIGISSISTGLIQACFDEMLSYSRTRTAFEKPIADFQAIQWMIADTAVDYEASRGLTLSAAWHKQHGDSFSDKAAMAKLFASEAANRAAYRAVQVHGGYGYSREFRVERLYRDARVLTLYEGTSEIQRLVIARNALKKL